MKKIYDCAIIGGGITGLSLAYFLLKKGIKPTIFEKENFLGGMASSFYIENASLEKFYHHFFAQNTDAFELLEELRIKDKLYWVYPKMGFYSKNKIYAFTTPFDLLGFKPLTLTERIKFGLFSLKIKQSKDWLALENITAMDWIIDNLGENIFQRVWKPMLRGKFGSYADKIPASFAWFRLKARSLSRGRLGTREKLGYLKGGYQVLVKALADKIQAGGGEIRLNSGINALPLPDFNFCVATTPNLPSLPQAEYLGNICAVIKMKRKFSDCYWINIGEEEIPFCALIEHTNAFDDPGYRGFKLLYVSGYLERQNPIWKLSDQEIFDKYCEGLGKIDPKFSKEDVIEYFVFREKFAQPVPTLGYSKKIPPFQIRPNFYYVNNAQIYPEDRGVSDSIKLAKKFVESLR